MQVRKFWLVVSFLIGCMPVLKAQTMTTEQYIATYKDIAIDEMHTSGIPAAIKLAQGILETQSGNGWLPGTLLGVLTIGVLRNGLNVMAVPSSLQSASIGVLVIVALLLDSRRRRA